MTRRAYGKYHDAGWILPTALGLSVLLVPLFVGLQYSDTDVPDAEAKAARTGDADVDADASPDVGADGG